MASEMEMDDDELCDMLDGLGPGEDGHEEPAAPEPAAPEPSFPAHAGAPVPAPESEPAPEPAPSPLPPPRPRRSLIDALAEARTKTPAVAAVLAEAAAVLAGGDVDVGDGKEEDESVASMLAKRRGLDGKTVRARKEKRARTALGGMVGAEAGTAAVAKGRSFDYRDLRFSKMNLRACPVEERLFRARFVGAAVMDIAELADDPLAAGGKQGECWVFGCLVKKHSKNVSRDGRKYAVWTISNMQTGSEADAAARAAKKVSKRDEKARFTTIRCLVFDSAFDAHHKAVEGAVFAMRKPSILPPKQSQGEMEGSKKRKGGGGGGGAKSVRLERWSGVCIKVSRKDDVFFCGVCKDFALCGKEIRDRGECGEWYNVQLGSMCAKHSAARLKALAGSMRMDVGNQERPGFAKQDTIGTIIPANVTIAANFVNGPLENLPQQEHGLSRVKPSLREREATKKLNNITLTNRMKRDVGPRSSSKHVDHLDALRRANAKDKMRAAARGPPVQRRQITATDRSVPVPKIESSSSREMKRRQVSGTYQTAVDALVKLGFTLDTTGSLIAPTDATAGMLGYTIRTAKFPSIARAVLQPASSDNASYPSAETAVPVPREAPKVQSTRPPTDRGAKISAGFAANEHRALRLPAPRPKDALESILRSEAENELTAIAKGGNPAPPASIIVGEQTRKGISVGRDGISGEDLVLSDYSDSEED